jgi:hypothetical protein
MVPPSYMRSVVNRNLVMRRIPVQLNKSLSNGRKCIWYLGNKWRIFHTPLDVAPQFWESTIKARCILHNFDRRNDRFQLVDTLYESIPATGTRVNTKGRHVRDYFAMYFTSPHGAVHSGTIKWHLDSYLENVFTCANYHYEIATFSSSQFTSLR